MELKRLCAEVLRSCGWEATIEASPEPTDQGGWRADVLGTDGHGRRIAFEAQLAPMTIVEGIERTARYASDEIAVVWVTTKRSSWLWHLPGVQLRVDDASQPSERRAGWTVVGGCADWAGTWTHVGQFPFDRFVRAVLQQRLIVHNADYMQVPGRTVGTSDFRENVRVWVKPSADVTARRERSLREAQFVAEEAEHQRHQENLKALLIRQRALARPVVEEAKRVSGYSWAWIGDSRRFVSDVSTLEDSEILPSNRCGYGVPVYVGSASAEAVLWAVISPVAARVTVRQASFYRHNTVRVYVADARERSRVAQALGWSPRSLYLIPPISDVTSHQAGSAEEAK